MANLKPSDLPKVTSLADDDIFVVETSPNNPLSLTVNKIEKKDLFGGYINDVKSLGLGESLGSTSGSSLSLKTLVDGFGIQISEVSDQLVISYTGTEESTSVSNIGSGVPLVSGISNLDVKVRTISGGSNIFIENSGETVYINFTGQNEATDVSNIGSGIYLVSGINDFDVKVRSISGGSNINITNSGETIFVDFTGQEGGGGGGVSSSAQFSFFSNAVNNNGIIEKTYYNTPTSDTYLSGIDVDSANDVTLYLRWDGPNDSYMGSGFIDGQQIDTGNIVELGDYTRRFEGYISGLNLVGKTEVTGIANGFTGKISLSEAGAGPTPLHVTIDNISNAIPKPGEMLGNSALKGDDTINVFATFDTSDVTGIKVYDSGISDGIGYTSYALTDTGDGNHTATIPVSIDSVRVGSQPVAIVANNNFGTAGNDSISSNSITLDQTYPSISASDPASYNGRSDGLRESETTTFVNSIFNWSAGAGDTVFYSGLNNDILISDSGVFQNPKTVSYNDGIFSNSDNITISASRFSNGATDDENVAVKIANGPIIEAALLNATATSTVAPNVLGFTEIKGGDTIKCYVYVDGNGVNLNQIELSVANNGISDGSQTAFTYYSINQVMSTGPYVGKYQYEVIVNVTSSTARDGENTITVTARNNFLTESDSVTSTTSRPVNNSVFPVLNISSVSYPGGQGALKNTESATVSNSASNYDSIEYSSPNSQLTISNSSTFEASKNCDRLVGSYNISTDNFTVTATKNSNGMVRSASTVVKIAHDPLTFSVSNLASTLSSSPAGVSDNFNLVSSQQMLEIPSLETNPSQTVPSDLVATASGTNTSSNNYRITVDDGDTKGTFAWVVSGQNLAGIDTTAVSVNPNYVLAGFSARTVASNPSTALGRGLFPVGTTISDPNDVTFENIAEGGSGPNGGTIYSYKSFVDGTQLVDSMDFNDEFAVCDSAGTASTTGDHCYNLDKTIRDANTSTAVPATANIKED